MAVVVVVIRVDGLYHHSISYGHDKTRTTRLSTTIPFVNRWTHRNRRCTQPPSPSTLLLHVTQPTPNTKLSSNDDDDEYSVENINNSHQYSIHGNTGNNKTHVDILWSYVYNLQRVRREHNNNNNNQSSSSSRSSRNNQHNKTNQHNNNKKSKEPIITSFLYFLQQPPTPPPTVLEHRTLLMEPLQRALIQSIRISSSICHDYRLIMQLVDSAIQYANTTTTTETSTTNRIPILDPRIIGEAITELYRCRANLNKIRTVWSYLDVDDRDSHSGSHHLWTRPFGALEMNALLQVYVQEGKVNAALDVYHQYPTRIDAYSVSLLLQVLLASVTHTNTKATWMTTVHPHINNPTLIHHANHTTTPYSERYRRTVDAASTWHHPELIPLLQTSTSNAGVWWQWNSAIVILDQAFTTTTFAHSATFSTLLGHPQHSTQHLWHNNPIWTMLLQLNEACCCSRHTAMLNDQSQNLQLHHDRSKIVHTLLRIMQQRNIQPDAITSTLLLSNLRSDSSDCEFAVSLLRNASTSTGSTTAVSNEQRPWTLAQPNEYMYSAVMTTCARQRQYPLSMQLLDEYEQSQCLLEHQKGKPSTSLPSNVYLYNSALQALTTASKYHSGPVTPKKTRKIKKSNVDRTKERISMAFQLYYRMTRPASSMIPNRNQPDFVTYNTLLAVLAVDSNSDTLHESDWKDIYENQFNIDMMKHNSMGNFRSHDEVMDVMNDTESCTYLEHLIVALLDRMVQCNIDRDTMTYKYAIRAMMSMPQSDPNIEVDDRTSAVLRLIRRAHMDQKRYKCRNIVTCELYNEALYFFAQVGNVIGIFHIMSMMNDEIGFVLDSDQKNNIWLHIINGLGNGCMTSALPAVLSGNVMADADLYVISTRLGLDWTKMTFPSFNANHFSAAISCCLKESDFESARLVLSRMRELGIRPTSETLHDISRSYAIIALEYKETLPKGKETPSMEQYSVIRARSSYTILTSIDNPSHSLVAIVSRACCSAGMFKEAQTLLRSLHQRVLQLRWEEHEANSLGTSNPQSTILLNNICRILSPLHQDLLRYCANQGNVTNALSLCEDIQYISKQFMIKSHGKDQLDTLNVTATIHHHLPIENTNDATQPNIGISISGWKSLLIAAAKSGHWRVCLSTLQFLRPYVETTRPSKTFSPQEQTHRDMLYGQLEPAINIAIKCLALRSQYGWIVRVIDDWIEWSGGSRRPPRDAILTAIRTLATRGRGEEVNNVLTRCVNIPLLSKSKYDDPMYNAMLYVGAITALYNEGLYDEADDAYVSAMTRHSLPLNIQHEMISATERRTTLDLHGMNQAVAHSAVRIALQQLAISADHWNRDTSGSSGSGDTSSSFDTDLIIITGRGLNSALKMRPVLRPVVQRMLVEEFYPPLSTISVPGNMGALRISSSDINEFLNHQRQQKGARLLLVAAMLKNIVAPGGRLRAALAQVNKGME